jgi:hypothetical protein
MQLEDMLSKPGSEGQNLNVFSHIWETDSKDKHMHKTNIIIYAYIQNVCYSGTTVWNSGKREKRTIVNNTEILCICTGGWHNDIY